MYNMYAYRKFNDWRHTPIKVNSNVLGYEFSHVKDVVTIPDQDMCSYTQARTHTVSTSAHIRRVFEGYMLDLLTGQEMHDCFGLRS